MNIICIKSGKCIKENSGFIEVNEGDNGSLVSKERSGDVIGFINGTRVIIPVDHLNHVEKSFLACFKVENSKLEESKIKVIKNKLEKLSGKKVVLK